jgi:hypothetical protein
MRFAPHRAFRYSHDVCTSILAWRVDFVLRLESFEPNVRSLRHLIDLAISSPLQTPPRILFTSSIGVVTGLYLLSLLCTLTPTLYYRDTHRPSGRRSCRGHFCRLQRICHVKMGRRTPPSDSFREDPASLHLRQDRTDDGKYERGMEEVSLPGSGIILAHFPMPLSTEWFPCMVKSSVHLKLLPAFDKVAWSIRFTLRMLI